MDKPDGVSLIAAERKRQIEEESWTPGHDDDHENEALALAAACYAQPSWARGFNSASNQVPVMWPWSAEWWKPAPSESKVMPSGGIRFEATAEGRVRELVKAGALIAAEIDRLTRKS